MNDELDRLMDLIRRQKDVYDDLLGLAIRKKKAIETGNVGEMDQVVSAEETLLIHVGELEQIRRQIAGAVAERCSIAVEELTLSNWPDLDPERRLQVETLQNSFRHTLDDISQVNKVNSRLLTIHLQYVQSVINEVTRTRQLNSYEADGTPLTRRNQVLNLIDEMM